MNTALELVDNKVERPYAGRRKAPQFIKDPILVGGGLLAFRKGLKDMVNVTRLH